MPHKGILKVKIAPEVLKSSRETKSTRKRSPSTSSSSTSSTRSDYSNWSSPRIPAVTKNSIVTTKSANSAEKKGKVEPSSNIKPKYTFKTAGQEIKSLGVILAKQSAYKPPQKGSTARKPLAKPLSSSLAYDTNLEIPILYVDLAKMTRVFMKMVMADAKNKTNKGKVQYEILDETKNRIFTAQEVAWCTGGSRPFQLILLNLNETIVLTVQRESNASLCFLGAKCYGSNATIKARSTEEETLSIIGSIRQKFECGMLEYEAFDKIGKNIMSIYGPRQRYWCRNNVGFDASFQIFATAEHQLLGELRVFSAPKSFSPDPFILSVGFPLELKPEYKILMLAVAALVNLSFFDTKHGCSIYGNVFFLLLSLVLICVTIFVFGFIKILL
ncbi:unnamed protein product [Allacma fusca]|uniref:Phospholipid scramblase n=1 Tax=Allacma fusca TaxID=39272 RepID=A0A8J2NU98_9HEXA|nr:unnamed protein product [Allacma fusca]